MLLPPLFANDQCDLNSVVIKGAADAEAVLCSATRTYALKIVETTNSLLLVPPVQVHQGNIHLPLWALLKAVVASAGCRGLSQQP